MVRSHKAPTPSTDQKVTDAISVHVLPASYELDTVPFHNGSEMTGVTDALEELVVHQKSAYSR